MLLGLEVIAHTAKKQVIPVSQLMTWYKLFEHY
jgi:hypothetical protein